MIIYKKLEKNHQNTNINFSTSYLKLYYRDSFISNESMYKCLALFFGICFLVRMQEQFMGNLNTILSMSYSRLTLKKKKFPTSIALFY